MEKFHLDFCVIFKIFFWVLLATLILIFFRKISSVEMIFFFSLQRRELLKKSHVQLKLIDKSVIVNTHYE